MKKNFWGYDIKLTDKQIDLLINQNNMLTEKIENLTMKLNSTNQVTESSSKENPSDIEPLLEEIQELKNEIKKLESGYEKQLVALRQDNQTLINLLEESFITSKEMSAASVGHICERAYKDMGNLKSQTAEDMLKHVDEFTRLIDHSNTEMKGALSNIHRLYNEVVSHIGVAISNMHENLKNVKSESMLIEQQILVTEDISASLKEKINSFVKDSIYQQNQGECKKTDNVSEDLSFDLEESRITKQIIRQDGSRSTIIQPYPNRYCIESKQKKEIDEIF